METAETVINVGSSGFGKSYIQGHDIEEFFSDGIFPIIVDKKMDHEQLAASLGFKKLKLGHQAASKLEAERLQTILERLKQNGASGVLFTFKRGDFDLLEEDRIRFVNELSKALLSVSWPNLLVLEELRNYAPSQSNDSKFHALRTIISEGRSVNTMFGATCQMPQQVHFKVFQVANIYRVFGLGNSNNKYQKLGIKGDLRSRMKNWSRSEFKYVYMNENRGLREVRSSSDISRRTEHSG